MKLRDNAKKGLQRMAEIGQMGNAEEVGAMSNSTFEDEDEDEEDTGQFESDIDEILAEDDGAEGQTERMMAAGGLAFKGGYDISKAPKNPVFDVRYLKHKDGRVMYITYINGKPLTPIPEGFTETPQEEAVKMASAADEAKKKEAAKTTEQETGVVTGQDGPGVEAPSGPTSTTPAMPGTVLGFTPMQMQTAGKALTQIPSLPLMLAGKGLGLLSDQMAQTATMASMGAVADEAAAQAPSAPATASQSASNAAVAAADASINSGHSNAASIAAANAAATAINSGASAAEAAQAGADAATSVDSGTGPSVGDSVTGVPAGDGIGVYARGGLVNKRKPKAKRGKGLVAQK
jgi:hypothetical protein